MTITSAMHGAQPPSRPHSAGFFDCAAGGGSGGLRPCPYIVIVIITTIIIKMKTTKHNKITIIIIIIIIVILIISGGLRPPCPAAPARAAPSPPPCVFAYVVGVAVCLTFIVVYVSIWLICFVGLQRHRRLLTRPGGWPGFGSIRSGEQREFLDEELTCHLFFSVSYCSGATPPPSPNPCPPQNSSPHP